LKLDASAAPLGQQSAPLINVTSGGKTKAPRVNVYCLPVKPRTRTDDEIFGVPNRNHGKNCPCCE
jgi:hypothetical protein